MPKPMSLAQYRASVKILGEKSALFDHKKEIFEALDMGLSHEQIHHFLTNQKGLKVSVKTLSKWIKRQKSTKPKTQILSIPFSQKSEKKEPNIDVQQQNEVVNQDFQGEPTTHSKVDDRALKVREKMGAATDGLPDGLLEMFSHTIL